MLSKISGFMQRRESLRNKKLSSRLSQEKATNGIFSEIDNSLDIPAQQFASAIRKAANASKKSPEETRRMLASLVGELDGYGQKLATAPSIKAFLTYRSALQKILVLSTDEAYALRTRQYQEGASTKEYSLVEVVSEEVDSLLTMVRHSNATPMQLTEKIVSIKGLVVNYFG